METYRIVKHCKDARCLDKYYTIEKQVGSGWVEAKASDIGQGWRTTFLNIVGATSFLTAISGYNHILEGVHTVWE
jgi:hypothetical protein